MWRCKKVTCNISIQIHTHTHTYIACINTIYYLIYKKDFNHGITVFCGISFLYIVYGGNEIIVLYYNIVYTVYRKIYKPFPNCQVHWSFAVERCFFWKFLPSLWVPSAWILHEVTHLILLLKTFNIENVRSFVLCRY